MASGTFAGADEFKREDAFADGRIVFAFLGHKRHTNGARVGEACSLSNFRQTRKEIGRIERPMLPRLARLICVSMALSSDGPICVERESSEPTSKRSNVSVPHFHS